MTRLLVMRRLTLEGVAPSEAARVARETTVDPNATPLSVMAPRGHGSRSDEHLEWPSAGRTVAPGRPEPPRGASPAFALHEASSAERAARGLGRAAAALDPEECQRIIRRHVEREGVVAAWLRLVSPVLTTVGERWESTGEGIETEHLLSECVVDVMRDVVRGLRNPRNARPVVLASAEDEQHGLPLHVLAAALAECSVSVRLFGVRVPREALAAAVRRVGPSVVFVYAHLPVSDVTQVADLPRLRPSPLVLLGGPGWNGVATPGGVERVGDLPGAVERIERAVGL
jgi:hypothetical protein